MAIVNFEQWEKQRFDEYVQLLSKLNEAELIAVAATALIYIDGLNVKNMICELIRARKNPEYKKDKP